jgi:hypothetical protein
VDDGAPFAALLLRQLRAKSFTFSDPRDCFGQFEKMTKDENEDRHAAAVLALGETWNLRAVPIILEKLLNR